MKKSIKKSSIRNQWILFSLVLCLIPFLLGIVVSSISMYQSKEQLLKNNEELLVDVRGIQDQAFRGVKLAMEEIANLDTVHLLSTTSHAFQSPATVMPKMKLQGSLLDYEQYNPYIQRIFVYFWDEDYVISSITSSSSNLFYFTYFKEDYVTCEDWLSTIKSAENGLFVCTYPADDSGNSSNLQATHTFYIKTYPLFARTPLYTVAIELDQKSIRVNASSDSQMACIDLIVDDSHSLLGHYEKDPSALLQFGNEDPTIQRYLQSEGTYVSVAPSSQFANVKYAAITQKDVLQSFLNNRKLVFILGLVTILAFGILISFYWIRNSYRPVSEIMSLLENSSSNLDDNEYSRIKSRITESLQMEALLQKKLNDQDRLLLEGSLRQVFHGLSINETRRSILQAHFPNETFSVFLLSMVPIDSMESHTGELMSFADKQLLYIHNLLREQSTKDLVLETLLMDSQLLLIINSAGDFTDEIAALQERIITDFRILSPACIPLLTPSAPHVGLESLPLCFEEASTSYQHALVFGSDTKSAPADPIETESRFYRYDKQAEDYLVSLISTGNEEDSLEYINTLWTGALEKNLSPAMLRSFLNQFVGTYFRICTIMSPDSTSMDEIDDILKELSGGSNDLSGIFNRITDLFLAQCRRFQNEYQNANDKLLQEILQFIDEHCSDPLLCVDTLIDEFGKSRSFLFSLFKESTEHSILYCINHARVEKAKALLSGTDTPVKDIAAQCGFSSTANLARVFKKYEEIQPSEYRRKVRPQQ